MFQSFFTSSLIYLTIGITIFFLLVKYINKQYNLYLETRLNTYTFSNDEIIPNTTYTFSHNKEQPIYLLWTGGFNSTFRLCNLLLILNKQVQPIYIKFENSNARNINTQEILTMKQIRKYIFNKYPHLQNNLLPTYYITNVHKNNTIEKDLETKIKNQGMSINTINHQYNIIKNILQFDYGFQNNIKCQDEIEIECGIHPDNIIYIRLLELMNIDIYKPTHITLRFPFVINNITYNEMWNEARKYRFDDILQSTWSCIDNTVINDKRCGSCSKCIERPFIHIILNKKIRSEKDDY